MADFVQISVEDALEKAISAAGHLAVEHSAHVAAARVLARRIDALDQNSFLDDNGKLDNVSIPAFLKYLDSLGLSVPPSSVGRRGAGVAPADQLAEMRKRLVSG